jgi:hypothetical protein
MTIDVFNPAGATFKVIAVGSPSQAVQCVISLQTPQYRVVHPGTELVWLGVGKTEKEAIEAATVGYGNGVPLLPGTDELFTFDKKTFFAACCEKATQDIFITPGYGM